MKPTREQVAAHLTQIGDFSEKTAMFIWILVCNAYDKALWDAAPGGCMLDGDHGGKLNTDFRKHGKPYPFCEKHMAEAMNDPVLIAQEIRRG